MPPHWDEQVRAAASSASFFNHLHRTTTTLSRSFRAGTSSLFLLLACAQLLLASDHAEQMRSGIVGARAYGIGLTDEMVLVYMRSVSDQVRTLCTVSRLTDVEKWLASTLHLLEQQAGETSPTAARAQMAKAEAVKEAEKVVGGGGSAAADVAAEAMRKRRHRRPCLVAILHHHSSVREEGEERGEGQVRRQDGRGEGAEHHPSRRPLPSPPSLPPPPLRHTRTSPSSTQILAPASKCSRRSSSTWPTPISRSCWSPIPAYGHAIASRPNDFVVLLNATEGEGGVLDGPDDDPLASPHLAHMNALDAYHHHQQQPYHHNHHHHDPHAAAIASGIAHASMAASLHAHLEHAPPPLHGHHHHHHHHLTSHAHHHLTAGVVDDDDDDDDDDHALGSPLTTSQIGGASAIGGVGSSITGSAVGNRLTSASAVSAALSDNMSEMSISQPMSLSGVSVHGVDPYAVRPPPTGSAVEGTGGLRARLRRMQNGGGSGSAAAAAERTSGGERTSAGGASAVEGGSSAVLDEDEDDEDDGEEGEEGDGEEDDEDDGEEDDDEDDDAYADHRLSYEGHHYGLSPHHGYHHSLPPLHPHHLDPQSHYGAGSHHSLDPNTLQLPPGTEGMDLGGELPVAPEVHSELMEAVMQQWLHTPAGQSAAQEAARLELSSEEVGQFFHARMLQSLGRLRIGPAAALLREQRAGRRSSRCDWRWATCQRRMRRPSRGSNRSALRGSRRRRRIWRARGMRCWRRTS